MSLPIEDQDLLFPDLRIREEFRIGGGNSPEKYYAFEYEQAEFLDKVDTDTNR